ncbi:MAG TPA: response regulator [Ohtaekwangia sp.]
MRKKIILIEDDRDACMLFSHVLQGAGYEVHCYYEGSVLLSADCPHADVYIIDNCLPDIDGIALTKYLKVKDATARLPVIIISSNQALSKKTMNAGASAFIPKPFDAGLLLHVIHNVLYNPEYRYFHPEEMKIDKR